MKRFDANACFGHWPYWDLYHKTPDELIRLMDANGIERAACMSLRGVFIDWRAGNEETVAAAKRFPDRLVPTATISPFLGGGAKALNEAIDAGARGIRLYPGFQSFRLDSTFVDEVCGVAGQRGAAVMIPTRLMMNWRFTPVPIESIGHVVARHANTRFLLSGPNYLVEYQAMVKLMKRCANLSYEISCLQGFGAVRNLAGEVGSERILFGTGAVLSYPACNVAKLDGAELTDAQRGAIAWDNACGLFGCPQ